MDAATTESAYASSALPADQVTFSWNDAGDTLTVTPKSKLAYAEGDAQVAALAYAIAIGTGARDRAGNALATVAEARFATLRQITVKAPLLGVLSGSATSQGTIGQAELVAGDSIGGISYRALLAFSLDAVPDGVELTGAMLHADELSLVGAPDSELGGLIVQHVYYDVLDGSAYGLEPMDQEIAIRTPASASKPASRQALVGDQIIDDLANRLARNGRAIFRLQFVTAVTADGNSDRVNLDPASAALLIGYLAP
jgi:hypothetical protein